MLEFLQSTRNWRRNEGILVDDSCRRYGDLSFNNILCDVVVKSLSFVDPGGQENGLHCDVTGRWYPASHDLAYLLYDTGATVKDTLGNPRARWRKTDFHRERLASLRRDDRSTQRKTVGSGRNRVLRARTCEDGLAGRGHRAGYGTCCSDTSPPAA